MWSRDIHLGKKTISIPNEFPKVLQTAVRVDVNRFYAQLFLVYCSSISRQLNAHQNSVFFIMTISSLVGKKCSLQKKKSVFLYISKPFCSVCHGVHWKCPQDSDLSWYYSKIIHRIWALKKFDDKNTSTPSHTHSPTLNFNFVFLA